MNKKWTWLFLLLLLLSAWLLSRPEVMSRLANLRAFLKPLDLPGFDYSGMRANFGNRDYGVYPYLGTTDGVTPANVYDPIRLKYLYSWDYFTDQQFLKMR